jgi:O-succinylbenzoate synthase
MKIRCIEVYYVKMPLRYPWRTAYGEDADIHSVFVKLVTEDAYGWSETTPLHAPCYSPEWAGGVYSLIKDFLAPRVIGQEIDNVENLLQLLSCFKGNPFAKAGIELAFWILQSKQQSQPLHRFLGGPTKAIAVGADFGVQDSLQILIDKVQYAINAGYPRIKLKFRLGWDINMLKAIRNVFPDHLFHIDCNAAFTLKQADLFQKVDRFDLAMIEQPLHYRDLREHALLQKSINTPICLDESITSPKMMADAIQLESCRYVNIKTGRVGGLYNAIKIHDMCHNAGIPCWVGGMLESAVGNGISIELATLPNFTYPADIFPSQVHYIQDLGHPEIATTAPGKIAVSSVPGTPYEPIDILLSQYALHHAIIKS